MCVLWSLLYLWYGRPKKVIAYLDINNCSNCGKSQAVIYNSPMQVYSILRRMLRLKKQEHPSQQYTP
jgi:hypothetical protein